MRLSTRVHAETLVCAALALAALALSMRVAAALF